MFRASRRLCSAAAFILSPRNRPVSTVIKEKIKNGPNLKEFLVVGKNLPKPNSPEPIQTYLDPLDFDGKDRKVYLEVYGCQMNVNDMEIILSILTKNGYKKTESLDEADVALVMTCAIREGAEGKIWSRLRHLRGLKRRRPLQIGLLGCMAERLKTQVIEQEKSVDVVCGPDAYRDLPRLLAVTKDGRNSVVNVLLSLEETYADTMPVRLNENAVSAYVSIMRGCDNMCSYCIVPFTRGRERSRPIPSIEAEVQHLVAQGVKEVTLLGQNVNSYRDLTTESRFSEAGLARGFRTVYKTKQGGARFAELLCRVAEAAPEMRIRFTSPHPKDFPDEVLTTIRHYPNICKSLHLPAQSGDSAVLERMRRGYSREAYLELVAHVREILPEVTLSSDFIAGFCGETEAEFERTLSLIEEVKYHIAFLFAYSMREKTTAHRRFVDDVLEEVKLRRVGEMNAVHRRCGEELNRRFLGQEQLVLIEGFSKRSTEHLSGRNDGNLKVNIPIKSVVDRSSETAGVKRCIQIGDFVAVHITETTSQSLKGDPLYITTLRRFHEQI